MEKSSRTLATRNGHGRASSRSLLATAPLLTTSILVTHDPLAEPEAAEGRQVAMEAAE
jgi:hypothetical protein